MKRKYAAGCLMVSLALFLTACAGNGNTANNTPSESSEQTVTAESSVENTESRPEQAQISMVRVNGGAYQMGSPETEADRVEDEVQHTVTVSDFYLGEYEVTQAQYEAVMGENPSSNEGADNPVENVSWFQAVEFCNRLSEQEGLTPAYTIDGDTYTWNHDANGYRLPTEAEWEYAARSGTETTYSTGDTISNEQATFGGVKTTAVGSHPANAFGLYDMHGNVFEWCWDFYGPYPTEEQTDPAGAEEGESRILRGGSCADQPQHLRSALRVYYAPTTEYYDVGFRVARSAE